MVVFQLTAYGIKAYLFFHPIHNLSPFCAFYSTFLQAIKYWFQLPMRCWGWIMMQPCSENPCGCTSATMLTVTARKSPHLRRKIVPRQTKQIAFLLPSTSQPAVCRSVYLQGPFEDALPKWFSCMQEFQCL